MYTCFILDCYLWKELLHISAGGVLFIDEECSEVRISCMSVHKQLDQNLPSSYCSSSSLPQGGSVGQSHRLLALPGETIDSRECW